jgi:hypothetical protein
MLLDCLSYTKTSVFGLAFGGRVYGWLRGIVLLQAWCFQGAATAISISNRHSSNHQEAQAPKIVIAISCILHLRTNDHKDIGRPIQDKSRAYRNQQ